MPRTKNQLSKYAAVGLVTALGACGSGGGKSERSGAATKEDFAAVLVNTVDNAIIPTYEALHARANDMASCVSELETNPSDTKVNSCKSAWIAARVPWEQSEAFLFGPVTDQGLDPAMDSWPVDRQQLDALLASSVTLTAGTIASNLGGGMKGFHTIEYLLWGVEQERSAAELVASPRELEYLVALTEALANDTGQLLEGWVGDVAQPGYGERFAGAGTSAGLYSSQLDAVQELIGGMANICDEVAFGKIAEPHKARDPNLIESQFSFNSLLDFADNMRSVRNVYLGSLDGIQASHSIAAVVQKYDDDLNDRVIAQIDTATNSILTIGKGGKTFRDAIQDPASNSAIADAQIEIGALMDLLNGEVMPLFAR